VPNPNPRKCVWKREKSSSQPTLNWKLLHIEAVATLGILESLGKILNEIISTQLPNTVIFKPYFQYLILEEIFKQETIRKSTSLFPI
jgi:hypothetical protein